MSFIVCKLCFNKVDQTANGSVNWMLDFGIFFLLDLGLRMNRWSFLPGQRNTAFGEQTSNSQKSWYLIASYSWEYDMNMSLRKFHTLKKSSQAQNVFWNSACNTETKACTNNECQKGSGSGFTGGSCRPKHHLFPPIIFLIVLA